MGQQTVRQAARRAALDVQSRRRRERAERERRLEDLAVRVVVAMRERDAAVAEAERRAGAALRELTDGEGLSVREAVEWCGDGLTVREATRLRRLSDEPAAAAADDKTSPAAPPAVAEALARGGAADDPAVRGAASS